MSEGLSQQERLQAIAEKKKRQAEVENKRRQLEDERRQLQHLKSKALRERWLLDGAPSAGSEEDEAKKQLQEDEAKTKCLEETILRLEQELEELETGVSATSTKENLSEVAKEEAAKPADGLDTAPASSVKAMYSIEITIEKDRLTGETKVLSTNTMLPKDLSQQGVKVYEDDHKVVHEVRGTDGAPEDGVRLLSSSEVDELIHKADVASASEGGVTVAGEEKEAAAAAPLPAEGEAEQTPKKEITGIEAKPTGGDPSTEATAENPVSMVFMGYQNVEDEAETKKVLGLEGTVKAELVVIEDGGAKASTEEAKEDQAPPNGSAADPAKGQEATEEKAEPEAGAAELKDTTKEKQPCKCCSVM
ncbi:paralemmin-1-like isoform X1 [Megalops cyprinoides]|uniref:paralemmin-1-like isoform X1 n=1 Tax=Megalops cyprinoides TaxID=118141 RepID=UPI00186476EB|nr:paralemmin-1-like isoform X1 [Megalops cyprinoides]